MVCPVGLEMMVGYASSTDKIRSVLMWITFSWVPPNPSVCGVTLVRVMNAIYPPWTPGHHAFSIPGCGWATWFAPHPQSRRSLPLGTPVKMLSSRRSSCLANSCSSFLRSGPNDNGSGFSEKYSTASDTAIIIATVICIWHMVTSSAC